MEMGFENKLCLCTMYIHMYTLYVLPIHTQILVSFWNGYYILGWNDFVITLLREFLYVICFNIRCIIWCLAYIFNLRPLKAKLRIIEAFGTFWQFLAIFAFLAELDNSKHFEPYFFFGLVWPFSALWPWKGPKAKMTGLLRYI